jgi:uncharacterized Ntn-hydrolase superfamily protein
MTFSIVAYDPKTGDFGVAVQSKFIGVGPIVPWAQANVGAIATQAFANTTFGPRGLELLKKGYTSQEVINKLIEDDEEREQRQFAVIDKSGKAAAWTGKECFYWAGHIIGENFSVQGNILVSEETVQQMAITFQTTNGDLADKLIAVLQSVDDYPKYGDVRGKESAALLIVREKGGYGGYSDRWVDIRVDHHDEPIKELVKIFKIYDMTFLSREDPSNLWKIEGNIEENIKDILIELNYLENKEANSEQFFSALEAWTNSNNFENKWVGGKIWKSVYDYMMREKGSPMVTLKKMFD